MFGLKHSYDFPEHEDTRSKDRVRFFFLFAKKKLLFYFNNLTQATYLYDVHQIVELLHML